MKTQIQTSVISNFLYIEVFTQVPWTSIYPSFTVIYKVRHEKMPLWFVRIFFFFFFYFCFMFFSCFMLFATFLQ